MYKDDFFSPFPPPLLSFNHYEESWQSNLMVEMHALPCGDQPSQLPDLSVGTRLQTGTLLGAGVQRNTWPMPRFGANNYDAVERVTKSLDIGIMLLNAHINLFGPWLLWASVALSVKGGSNAARK